MNHSSPLNEVPDPNQANQCVKVFVQRDYSDGTMIKFQTRFPPELEDKVCTFHQEEMPLILFRSDLYFF